MANFIDIDIEQDPEQLKQEVYEAIQAVWPDWEPAEGNLETWLVEAFTNQTVDLKELASSVPAEIFKRFGDSILGVPPLSAAAAVATTEWTMVDNAGYTIPADTLVGISATGSDIVAFANLEDIVVPPGDTVISGIELTAVEAGVAGNGLIADPSLIDAQNFVESITLTSATSGGSDEEAEEDYLQRLADELQLLTPRPILPADFEVIARESASVYRAIALDGYNPGDDTFANERMVAVSMVDEDGVGVSSGVKTEVEERLEALREVNFIVHTMDPDYTIVDVDAAYYYRDGFDPAIVEASVTDRINAYLSPASWAQGYDEPMIWRRVNTLRINDLVAEIDGVPGVDSVISVEVAEDGDPTAATDLTLNGPASLTQPGAINLSGTLAS